MCSKCHQIAESDPCAICEDKSRDQSLLCVVEQPLDLIALEKSEKYNGLYHVLHGCIDPLNHVGPDELYLNDLPKGPYLVRVIDGEAILTKSIMTTESLNLIISIQI